jgi:hypothetical protein
MWDCIKTSLDNVGLLVDLVLLRGDLLVQRSLGEGET